MSYPASALLFAVYGGHDDPSFPQSRAERTDAHRETVPSTDELELVARLVLGDADAFRELLLQHFDALARFATSMLGDRDMAEDVVQTVLARLWERHREFAPGMPIRAYLYRAVRNRALDAISHAAVRARGQLRLQREHDASMMQMAPIEHPGAEALRVALLTLTERRRTALRLRYEEGLGYAEIGAVMGVSSGSAEQLVFHAIRALRKKMTGSI